MDDGGRPSSERRVAVEVSCDGSSGEAEAN